MCALESKAETGEAVRRLGWSRRSNWKPGNFCIILQSSMRSGFICRFSPSAKCLVCGLALLALFVPSLSHAQVIEEDGFPVKGGGIGGEPFSLSCPPRLYIEAGESVLFSCSVTSVPEEGVRYEWESLSGDGLRLLSDANERSPLFTAPVSGEGAEYAYRLTAMSVGVYETATVTVVVGGVSGGSVQDRGKSPGLPEGCDSFGAFEGFREGCVGEDKAPGAFEPFGGGFEEEEGPGLFFPEAPGLPDRPSGPVRDGGPARQTPPRLECPVAVFLEELETGQIECHAWDAAGEEYLEYAWEPAGSTTRDYLDNPRLMPEDAPNPSVVAPEAPAYETLESFRSGDRAFRYRYRLTVTSRATGLSSSSEVEVYVSSSRPSVYCPLEIVVEESETTQLDCEGVDPLSARMDYDEEAASVLWEWEGLWGTSTAPLDATDRSSALFTAPLGSAGKQYHYIASMTSSASGVPRMARRRVSVTVRVAESARDKTEAVGNSSIFSLTRNEFLICNNHDRLTQTEGYVYLATPDSTDFVLDCGVSNLGDYSVRSYLWRSANNETVRLSRTDIRNPVFEVPDEVATTTAYRYAYSAIIEKDSVAAGLLAQTVVVYVSPIVNSATSIKCEDTEVYEATADFTLNCSVANEPSGATYAWAVRGSTLDTDDLSSTTILKPTFDVPDNINESEGADKDYEYTVTLSASGIEDITADVTVTVLEKPDIYCPPFLGGILDKLAIRFWEGEGDFPLLTCGDRGDEWGGAPAGSDYAYAWTTRGSTPDTRRLSATNIAVPTFDIPDAVESTETYEYTLTVSAENADDASVWWTVYVWPYPYITVTCEDSPYRVLEGDADIDFACEASGAPGSDPQYTWSWSPTTNLTDHNTATPTFAVPDDVDQDTTYTYTVTATADNADDGTAEVRVTVRDTDSADPSLTCTDSEVYEGTADFTLDCEVENEPTGATYAWVVRGSTLDTDDLSSTTILKPTFDVPDDIPGPPDSIPGQTTYKEIFQYELTLSASGISDITADVTVTVLEKPDIGCRSTVYGHGVYEGEPDFPIFRCFTGWKGAPGANPVYTYAWTARGSTPDTRRLSATDIDSPVFDMPDAVDGDETYEYTLTVSAENADDFSQWVYVTVVEKPDITITCEDSPYEVDEGDADIELECEASTDTSVLAVPGDNPDYTWSWSPTASLTDHNTDSPTFAVPADVDQDTTWTYTVTATTDYADDGTAEVTVTVRDTDSTAPVLACNDSEIYEATADLTLDCSVTDEPTGATYAWAARGSTSDTNDLSSTTILKPAFSVPYDIDEPGGADKAYEYTVTLSASGITDVTEDVKVTVLEKPNIRCHNQPVYGVTVFTLEGRPDFHLRLCPEGWEGAPGANPVYTFAWTARGSTPDTRRLSATDIAAPRFDIPEEVEGDETYSYTATVSAENADDLAVKVTVVVRGLKPTAPVITCTDSDVYEATADFTLNCSVTDEPTGATYAWTGTDIANRLSSTTILKPTFDVPDNVDAHTDYDYTVTLSASGINDVTEDVTVRVLNKPSLALVCTPPAPVYEGAASFDLDCSASGDPSGSDNYTYVWTARGSTVVPGQLSSTTVAKPTFDVPDNVDADTDYEYTLTVSADNAEDATADVTVTVLNKKALNVACATPSPVYEGSADLALDCVATGAPAGSAYTYVWTARGATTNTDLLVSGTGGPTPTFAVPDEVDDNETHEYLLTVSAANAEDASAEVTVTVLNLGSIALICASPPLVYEGSEDFALVCSVSGDTGGANYTYEWTARGATPNTDELSATDIPSPTFAVPDEVDETTTYEYALTARAANVEDATAAVTVTVLNRGTLAVACAPPPLMYEGSEDFALDCTASGAPSGSAYEYVWTARGSTANMDLLISGTDGPTPTFAVPDEVAATTTYEYLLTVSAENAESSSAAVTVTVLNAGALHVVCTDPPSVYEGSEDFDLDCTASGAPVGSVYEYVWTARSSTANTDLLIAGTDGPTPTFAVPDEVASTTTYEYLLTVSAENAESGSAAVTVTVLNAGALHVVCADPSSVYEGSEDLALDCTASGAPAGSSYEYVWTARGSTANTDLLSRADISSPTFYVPDEVDETTTYEYLLTVSAENAEDATAEVTVTVLNRGPLNVVCADPASIYEGAEDFALDCSASGAPAGSDYAYAGRPRAIHGTHAAIECRGRCFADVSCAG